MFHNLSFFGDYLFEVLMKKISMVYVIINFNAGQSVF